jgi:two-component system, chemotaxis family, sensor kinase CheA
MMSLITRSIVRAFNAVVLLGIVIGLGIFTVVIGMYNYDRSMSELTHKASNTADLASISLTEPIWNYDAAAMDGILNAILLDADVIGIRVVKTNGEMAGEKIREGVAETAFDELLKTPSYIQTGAKINRDGEMIATVQIVTSTETVKALIRYTSLLIGSFSLVFLLIIASFIWLLGKRIIQRPIDALRNSADQLASGNLGYPINTQRNDELGSLAVSFDQMRNAIRKKLADLAILNHTGEVMAGIHDQTAALETVIKVMSEQTCVERGSIYLLDEAQNLTLHAYYPEMGGGASFPKSFKLSEGVAGHVASTGKILFIPDVSKASDYYVGLGAGDQAKALLCVPMMDDKSVFGVMNFVGEVGKVSFADEDEGFALTIARMAVITTKNIQMLEVIAEQNRTLEERILLRTRELRQKTNDVSNMLQNMRQGIFTIVDGAVIHAEYSAFLCEIFETTTVAEQRVSPFLFARSSVGGDILNQVEATLDAMIGEDAMNFEFNSHLLVNEYTKLFDGERTKILELDWNPVLDGEGLIDKLMVTVRDVTELKALQLETEKQKEQLEIIGQILAVSKDKLLEFIKSSYEFMDENQLLISNTEEKNLDVIATLFRNMHTIKGNARTYGLSHVTDSVHEAESVYSRLRSEDDFPWDQTELLEQLQGARNCVARYEMTFKEKLAGFSDESGGVDPAVLESISSAIDSINEMSQVNDLKHSIQLIRNSINTFRYESVGDMLKGILAALPSIAKQLDKELPEVLIVDNYVRLSKEVVPMLRNVFMHIFRNSLDHGLEATEERLAKGKSARGLVRLHVSLDADQVLFSFSDDGKGLALEGIKNKAIANGQLVAGQVVSDEQIAEFIFMSGLSTATAVTHVSGRGVGMDAIRKFLQKYHGNVQVIFPANSAVDGFRAFELRISLPAKFALNQS